MTAEPKASQASRPRLGFSFVLNLAGALLLIVAQPPIGWWWALPLGLLCLAIGKTGKIWVHLVVGAIYFGIQVAWLRHVSVIGWGAAVVVGSVIWAAPWVLWGRRAKVRVVAALLVLLEYLRGWVGIGWLSMATAMVGAKWMMPWVALGGQGLAGGLLALTVLAGVRAMQSGAKDRNYVAGALIGVVLLIAGGGLLGVFAPAEKVTRTLRVGFVQPNTPMSLGNDNAVELKQLQTVAKLSNQLKGRDLDFVLWPEQLTPWPVNADLTMREWVEEGAKVNGFPIVSGVLWQEDERYYNAAAVINPEGGLQEAFYGKRRLVPFGEYIPFAEWGWVRSLTPIVDSFAAGTKGQLLEASGVKLWPLICYEDIFPELSVGAHAADMIVVFTNDGWFGLEGAQEQHAAHSILRAIEQGRPLVRIGNNGVSGAISPTGKLHAIRNIAGATNTAQAGVLEVALERRDTVYSHTAGVWPWVFVGLLLTGCVPQRKKKENA